MTKNVQDQIFEFIEPPTEKYQWYILFVASGKEFKIRDKIYRLDNFQNKIIQIWIPSINRFIHIKGKKEVIRETFFNSYVFLLIDLDVDFFRRITEIEDVFCFLWNRGLYSKDPPSPIPFEQIQIAEQIIEKMRKEIILPCSQFANGDYVRISSGIFKNLKGFVKEIRKHFIIIDLETDIIHRQLAISVQVDHVEKLASS
jgi:transcription antitermination factor NusG